MTDERGVFIGQTVIRQAGLWGRLKLRASAKLNEFINTDYASSGKLLDRIGDADDTDRTETRATNRFDKIEKLRKMFKGEAKWGNEFVQIITGFHTALQAGRGIRTTTTDKEAYPPETNEELAAWDEFLDANNFDGERLNGLCQCGELDGQILIRFEPDYEANTVRAWIEPLLEKRYKVKYHKGRVDRVILNPDADNEEVLGYDEFVFVKLRGLENGTYGTPTCSNVIKRLEDLDKALNDLRKINELFAKPTPVFTAKNAQAQAQLQADLVNLNWKIGQAIVLLQGDTFTLEGPPAGSLETLLKEIVNLVQIISGATGVPVHVLGFPDLMSNRSVADMDMEVPVTRARNVHEQLEGMFEELAVKVLAILSFMHGRNYDPDIIETKFPDITAANSKELVETWLPARQAREISSRYFLQRIGHPDPEAEIEELENERGDEGGGEDDDEDQEAQRIESVIALNRTGTE